MSIWQSIQNESINQKVPVELIVGIIQTESAGDPFAMRFEPNYSYLVNYVVYAKQCNMSPDTEKMLQKSSFGLMQVMGGKSRELGFQKSLLELFIPENNIKYGVSLLKNLMDRYHDRPNAQDYVISGYNLGSALLKEGKFINQNYVDTVKKWVKLYLAKSQTYIEELSHESYSPINLPTSF